MTIEEAQAVIQELTREQEELAKERGDLLKRVMELEFAYARIAVDERLPEPGERVLAFFRYPATGKWQVVRAMHAPHLTLNTEDWGDFEPDGGEHDEATDATYWPEGWYESNEFEETHWALEHEPSHWMPIPSPPAPKTEA